MTDQEKIRAEVEAVKARHATLDDGVTCSMCAECLKPYGAIACDALQLAEDKLKLAEALEIAGQALADRWGGGGQKPQDEMDMHLDTLDGVEPSSNPDRWVTGSTLMTAEQTAQEAAARELCVKLGLAERPHEIEDFDWRTIAEWATTREAALRAEIERLKGAADVLLKGKDNLRAERDALKAEVEREATAALAAQRKTERAEAQLAASQERVRRLGALLAEGIGPTEPRFDEEHIEEWALSGDRWAEKVREALAAGAEEGEP